MTALIASRLVCSGCGRRMAPDDPAPYRCPAAGAAGREDVDHVLRRQLLTDAAGARQLRSAFDSDEPLPFLRYRELLHAYRAAIERGRSDGELVSLIEELDAAVAAVDGRGFRETPLVEAPELATALGVSWVLVKDETGNVSGSHKGRHLFGLMLWLRALEEPESRATPLAIASCGNAALAAAVVARAVDRELEVFVPPDADGAVLRRLEALGATLRTSPRRPGESGDPCYLRFTEAVRRGALPFTCQGNQNALTLDGGRTLAWEIVSRLAAAGQPLDRLFIQVGGGALASSCAQALEEAVGLGVLPAMPKIHAVQTEGAHPLERAYRRLAARALEIAGLPPGVGREDAAERAARLLELEPAARAAAISHAAAHRGDFMWPWEEEPRSLADGILDDETYDWLTVLRAMIESGGFPVTVTETELRDALELGRRSTGIPVDPTGSAGLAGALQLAGRAELGPAESVGLLFTGVDRSSDR